MLPRALSQYTVKLKLGSGGMADVWLASVRGPKGFEKQVVLKTMIPGHSDKPDLVEMFAQEAAIAAKLSHPGIVQINDFGSVDGLLFIAMEYVVGCTLRQLGRPAKRTDGAFPLLPILHVVADCCESLQYVHEFRDEHGRHLGLVHRDVSPENIMVTLTGHTKLLDFGVVSASAAGYRTKNGLLKGKYAYMSPEAIRGEPPTPQRDVYSLGVILYELLTGQRPFAADTDAELIYRITHQEPLRPRALSPLLPDDLEEIVMRAMARRVRRRYTSAAELGSDLRTVLRKYGPDLGRERIGAHVAKCFARRSDLPASLRAKDLAVGRHLSSVNEEPTAEDFEILICTSDVECIDSVFDAPPRQESGTGTDPFARRPPARGLRSQVTPFDVKESPGGTVVFDLFGAYTSARSRPAPSRVRSELSIFDRHAPTFTSGGFAPLNEAARHFDRGLHLLKLGDEQGALAEWELALVMAPNNKTYQANIERLRRRME